MGLEQDVVIVNRFSVPDGRGGGSRGGTPGRFIIRYMSRDDAIENIAPTRLQEINGLLDRFDARFNAYREADPDDFDAVRKMTRKVEASQKKGGVAFTSGDPAMSDEKLFAISDRIQDKFEEGHTAMEMVISFTDEYLRKNGLLDPDFRHERAGDYAGHVDQLKLRLAVMNGLDRLKVGYDDLVYAGVFHVDKNHVHCHVVMMDMGEGNRLPDGSQKGKVNAKQKERIRRGVDSYLDQKQSVKMLSSSVAFDKRNLLCYVKRFTYLSMERQSMPQLILASLPPNRNWWRADTNRREMRQPNALVREFVLEILQPDAQVPSKMYMDAHAGIVAYADGRQAREGFGEEKRMQLIRNGEERLVKDCMNGVYSVLKDIPKERMNVSTPMMDIMAMPFEDMAARAIDDPSVEFGFKLRSYSCRLNHHRKEYHRYEDEADAYDKQENKSEDSEALGRFLRMEAEYQRMLMVKYQYFLAFLPPGEFLLDEYGEVLESESRLEAMEAMDRDSSLKRMGRDAADRYGLDVYDIANGSQVNELPGVWSVRLQRAKDAHAEKLAAFRKDLSDYGIGLNEKGLVREMAFPFDEVKALDLHHMGYDYPYDVAISKDCVDSFVSAADKRYAAFEAARDYLEASGQGPLVADLSPGDVMAMKAFADSVRRGKPELKAKAKEGTGAPPEHAPPKSYTIPLGRDYVIDMRSAIRGAAEATRQLGDW